ncbi:hypothetical protein KCP71_15380 [Salmonella enterica subsp. enterica]|nr:hypothetical protein KCP71_15380 [Salmonella enterica subsp. enterica]
MRLSLNAVPVTLPPDWPPGSGRPHGPAGTDNATCSKTTLYPLRPVARRATFRTVMDQK